METKVVLNEGFGGFCLSEKALKELAKLKFPEDAKFLDKIPEKYFSQEEDWVQYQNKNEQMKMNEIKDFLAGFECGMCDRTDKDLVRVVESLGEEAQDEYSSLKVVPASSLSGQYQIKERDGYESVSAAEDIVFEKMYKEPKINDTLGKNELCIMLAIAEAIKDLENRAAIIKDRYSEMCKMHKTGLYDKERFEGAYLAVKHALNNLKPIDFRIAEAKEYTDKLAKEAKEAVHKPDNENRMNVTPVQRTGSLQKRGKELLQR